MAIFRLIQSEPGSARFARQALLFRTSSTERRAFFECPPCNHGLAATLWVNKNALGALKDDENPSAFERARYEAGATASPAPQCVAVLAIGPYFADHHRC
jgi:hypothetical protein